MTDLVKWAAPCPSHPEGGTHECMQDERRCVYCAQAIEPYPCHGCGQFLPANVMHDDIPRCDGCA